MKDFENDIITDSELFDELNSKLEFGLDLAYKRLVVQKIKNNLKLIVMRDDKIQHIDPMEEAIRLNIDIHDENFQSKYNFY